MFLLFPSSFVRILCCTTQLPCPGEDFLCLRKGFFWLDRSGSHIHSKLSRKKGREKRKRKKLILGGWRECFCSGERLKEG